MIADSVKQARPLSGIRILVGRARHQAGSLSRELRNLGAEILEIPFIEIRKPQSFQPLDAALKKLDSYDWLILTSVNGVEAMWERLAKLKLDFARLRGGHDCSRAIRNRERKVALAAYGPGSRDLRIAAIGPATRKAIEQRGVKVDVVPKEYVAESVVRSLRRRVKGKRVLLVRAKVARDVIPQELRCAGAQIDVVEAYETMVPAASGKRLRGVLNNPARRPHLVTFTSSSTVRNFIALLRSPAAAQPPRRLHGHGTTLSLPNGRSRRITLDGIRLASIGPVTSSTLRELNLFVDIEAKRFTIPGLVEAIIRAFAQEKTKV